MPETVELTFGEPHHIGVVVKDIKRAIETFSTIGFGPFEAAPMTDLSDRELRGKPTPGHVDVWFTPMGKVNLELVQPLDGTTLQQETLEIRGEGLEHIGFFVEDLWKKVARMTAQGWTIVARARGHEKGGWAFLEPAEHRGLYVELVEPWE